MKLSRNQKRYAYVLGACFLALVADRLFLAPSDAEAGETGPVTEAPTNVAPTTRAPRPTTPAPRKPLADRFDRLAEEYEIDLVSLSDPFQVPTEWLPETPDPHPGPIIEPDDPDVKTFRENHRLNAVMALESGGYAIVDGRRLRMGQEIDGFRLTEIRSRSIVLESEALQRVELKLLDSGAQGGMPQPNRRPH